MTDYTLTYSEGAKGWTSFFSYYPDFMIGMNQFFYSFAGGNLYRHNTNEARNKFYYLNTDTDQWELKTFESKIVSLLNENPLENKLFKTIELESDVAWLCNISTDIQNSGLIESNWFEKKEGAWYGFVRSNLPTGADVTELQFELRSLNGIAQSFSVGGTPTDYQVNFTSSIDIGSIVSVGDYLYYALPPYDTPIFAGEIKEVNIDKRIPINQIIIDGTVSGATNPIPINDAYFLYIKNPVAESHGIMGHYCEFTLTLEPSGGDMAASELFAVGSEVMKSFP